MFIFLEDCNIGRERKRAREPKRRSRGGRMVEKARRLRVLVEQQARRLMIGLGIVCGESAES